MQIGRHYSLYSTEFGYAELGVGFVEFGAGSTAAQGGSTTSREDMVKSTLNAKSWRGFRLQKNCTKKIKPKNKKNDGITVTVQPNYEI